VIYENLLVYLLEINIIEFSFNIPPWILATFMLCALTPFSISSRRQRSGHQFIRPTLQVTMSLKVQKSFLYQEESFDLSLHPPCYPSWKLHFYRKWVPERISEIVKELDAWIFLCTSEMIRGYKEYQVINNFLYEIVECVGRISKSWRQPFTLSEEIHPLYEQLVLLPDLKTIDFSIFYHFNQLNGGEI